MKNILITGATSGIGNVTTEILLQNGYHVVMVARNKEKLEKIHKNHIENTTYTTCDLSHLDDIASIFRFCEDNNIKLDVLVHCARAVFNSPVKTCRKVYSAHLKK